MVLKYFNRFAPRAYERPLRGKEMEDYYLSPKIQKRIFSMRTNKRPTCPKHSPPIVKGFEPTPMVKGLWKDKHGLDADAYFCPVCEEFFFIQKKRNIKRRLWSRPWAEKEGLARQIDAGATKGQKQLLIEHHNKINDFKR
jgi:hypothetical protein